MRVEDRGISPKSRKILYEDANDMASDVQTIATNNSVGQRLSMNVQVEKKVKQTKKL